ncbi:MAG: long-chain fatty acid--CoA ligase [Desulfobacteraceae bacterium]|nr:long-chain fatty acid--CoA ligase [Desulfobacteraceae bacterium]
MLYGDWIGRWGKRFPEKEALVDVIDGRRYTYGQLADDVHRMANFLRSELGIRHGDRVAILSFNRAEYIKLFFASSRLGAILVPLNFRLASDEFIYYLEDSVPKALFFDRDHQSVVDGLKAKVGVRYYICLDQDDSVGPSLAAVWKELPSDPPQAVEIAAEDPQLIIYTSGTTGLPKGVVLTHGMITWNSFNTNIGWDLRSDDSTVLHSAMFYTAGWNVFTLPLFHCRGTNVLVKVFEPDLILELIERERLTLFFGVPTMYQMLMESPKFPDADFSSIRFMVSGGAPLSRKIFEAFKEQKGIHLSEGYGLTEVGPNNFLANGKLGTVGHTMFHVDMKILGPDGEEVPPGEDGELLIGGDQISAGYWNKPEETVEAIKDGWFHTGDLARIDEDGHLSIVGRKKDMLISGGINIYPAEIERAIETHPLVKAAAVIGVPDEKWGEVGKAILELHAGSSLTLEELHDFLRDRLGKFKIPKYMSVVDELPRTAASGKVQKFILKERHGKADNE